MSKSTVIIQMDENYPDISSGIVSFENTRTGTKISIKAPDDFLRGIYGINMKSRRFWPIYLSTVTLILAVIYVFAASSMEVPFVISENQMRALSGAVSCIEYHNGMRCLEMSGCDTSTSCYNESGTINGKEYYSHRYVSLSPNWYECQDRNVATDKCCLKEPWVVPCQEKYYSEEGCPKDKQVYSEDIERPSDCTSQEPG